MLDEMDEAGLHVAINQNVGVIKQAGPQIGQRFINAPFMLDEMRVLICKRGHAQPIVNLLPLDVEAGDLVFLGQHSMVENKEFSDEMLGEGLSMTNEIFRMAMGETIPSSFDGHLRSFKISLEPDEKAFIGQIIDMMYDTIRQSDYSSRVFLSLAATFWWYVDALYKRREQAENHEQSREQQLFAHFIALVNEHARTEHNLSFYADRLFLSQRYMGTIIKQVSGRSAKEWIDEALATAIKVELRHTAKPLKEIAYEMSFPNMSFFSKFFKRMTGLTPMDYRKECMR